MRLLLTILATSLAVFTSVGQSIYTEFGKNRIQYHDDFNDWWMYESENFVTYWYGKGRNVAETVIQLAEHDNASIQNVLEHRFNDKIQIIVYVDLTDLKQTNIGQEEQFTNHPGRAKVLGNKIFVHYDGNHQNLRRAVRQGVATVYLESMLYGSNIQEVVQNAVLLHLPDWFKDGLESYLGIEWNADINSVFRDHFFDPKGKNKDFEYFARDYPALAGHSMWNYIGKSYGKSSISNLLYLSRINRNFESAFLYVIGRDFESIMKDWQAFYESFYETQDQHFIEPDPQAALPIRNRRNAPFTSLTLSPDGRFLAYVLNEKGKAKVYVMDLQTGLSNRIFKTGIRNNIQQTDYNYPLLAWRPEFNQLAVLYEKRDVIHLSLFEPGITHPVVHQPVGVEYQRIYSMDFWTPDTLIFAATTDGYADLYKYMPVTRQSIRITNDFYDDLDATVARLGGNETKGILFSSNRTNLVFEQRDLDTLMPVENYDIYFMYPDSGTWRLLNFTQTPYSNERQPHAIGLRSVVYLSNESGIWNRKAAQGPLSDQQDIDFFTSYNRNIIEHITAPGLNSIYDHMVVGCRHLIVENHPSPIEPLRIPGDGKIGESRAPDSNMDDRDVVDERYLFQSRYVKPRPKQIPAPAADIPEAPQEQVGEIPAEFLKTPTTDDDPVTFNPSRVPRYIPSRAIAHRLHFRVDYITATLDNSLLFTELDAYAATKQGYDNPPLGILIKGNIKDLFDDYVIEGGVRFPTTFNGSEYYLYFDNRKKRIDKRFALYRKTTTETIETSPFGPEKLRYISTIGAFTASYPFDMYRRLNGTVTLRNDRSLVLATSQANLETPINDEQRIGLKVEYVYDNTLEIDVNYLNGTRYKVWAELVKRFDLNLFEGGEKLTFNKGFMTVVGIDFRHYQRIDRHAILAMRFIGSTSFGSERNLYYLGGVENWMFSSFDNTIPVPGDKNFAYQTIAAQMRGFKFNARNGSSVMLVNTELRIPFVKYLSKKKIRSSILRNLQVVGFLDVGTAWHGSNPFSDENPLNTLTLTNPPTVLVNVKYYRNPIVLGYGAGVRTMLLGYFLKLDYGWGLETGKVSKPILYFSLGTDF